MQKVTSELFRKLSETDCLFEYAISTYRPDSKSSDIDLFIIQNDNIYLQNVVDINLTIQQISHVISSIENNLNIQIIVSSSFQTQSYLYHSRIKRKNAVRLHLLIYPSLDNFIKWEDVSLLYSVATNATFFVGDQKLFKKIIFNIPVIPIKDRLAPLIALGTSTLCDYQFSLLSSGCVEEQILQDAVKKMKYVAKYTLWQFIWDRTGKVPSSDLTKIVNHGSSITKNDKKLTSSLKVFAIDKKTEDQEISEVFIEFMRDLYAVFDV